MSSSSSETKPPVSELESGATESAAEGDSTLPAAFQSVEEKSFRFWHSRHLIVAAPISAAAIAVVVWLTLFSRVPLDNSANSALEHSNAAPADATAGSKKKDMNPQAPEQTAATGKNESPAGTLTPNGKPADKSDAKHTVENPVQAKPQSGQEASQSKTPDLNEPDQNTLQAKTSETKPSEADTHQATASAGEKNNPAQAESRQNHQTNEPLPPVIGTSRLVKLVVPETIDVQSRLGEVIPAIEFRDMPFARAIGLLAALSGLPITIDPEAVARLQISLRDPITIRMTGATLEEVLQEIVAKQGMSFTAEDGQLLVTDPAEQREKIRRIRYTVSDLTNNDKSAADQLAALVQKLIAPQSWQSAGGEGTIETEKTALVVAQTAAVHDQILIFCEKLRNARGRPLKSTRDPKRFEMTTRLQQAASALNRQVTANFHEPAKLVEILAYLGQQAEIDILIDRQALGSAGLSDKSEISFVVENRPLAAALNDLLAPLKLDYRPINSHTLQVTTQSALNARLELEFYPVGKMLGKDLSGSDLIERIKTAVSPTSWNGAGPTAIYFDQPAATLIVLQSPPVQAAIQAYLDKLAEKTR